MPNPNTSLDLRVIRCAAWFRFALPLMITVLFLAPDGSIQAQSSLRERLKGSPFKIAYECYVNTNWEIFVMNATVTPVSSRTTAASAASAAQRLRNFSC